LPFFKSYGQIKIEPSLKMGVTLANFTDGPDTLKSKMDYDFAFEVFAKLNSKWSLDLEWDNCTYGTRTHNEAKTRRLRLHLYYTNIRLRATYSINDRLSTGIGFQYGINYLGRTVVTEGIKKTVTGEDDFKSFDYGPIAELRYRFADGFFAYANGYYGLKQINLKSRGTTNIHNIATQFGIGAYLSTRYK
jgi:hypothetical protein